MNEVKEQISEKLRSTGSLNSADVAEFTPPDEETTKEEEGSLLDQTTKEKLPPEAHIDPVVRMGESSADMMQEQKDALRDFGGFKEETVEITADEKHIFLLSVADNDRFRLPFSIFNGKVAGVFRSRRNSESRAIFNVLGRQWADNKLTTEIEYSSAFRAAVLRFQLEEFSGVNHPEVMELNPTTVYDEDNKPSVKLPDWLEQSEKTFGEWPDGMMSAVYRQLIIFEKKYWVMVAAADNQDFWQTEGSTLA